MSKDKYPSSLVPSGGYCVYNPSCPSNLFRNAGSIENEGIFGHVTCSDQSHVSKTS